MNVMRYSAKVGKVRLLNCEISLATCSRWMIFTISFTTSGCCAARLLSSWVSTERS